jgi:hypothetical protein
MGAKVFGRVFSVEAVALAKRCRRSTTRASRWAGTWTAAASASTSVAATARPRRSSTARWFSEEIAWDPIFRKTRAYHLEGVHDTLKRAAAHLPRVDAIGGSAAGVYVNNEVRVASLFRGVPADAFENTSAACSSRCRSAGAACRSRS